MKRQYMIDLRNKRAMSLRREIRLRRPVDRRIGVDQARQVHFRHTMRRVRRIVRRLAITVFRLTVTKPHNHI